MSQSALHRIRLAGPWNCQPQRPLTWPDCQDDQPRRVKPPVHWSDLFGAQAGRATFTRHFNRPTGIQSERLLIAINQLGSDCELVFNRACLGQISPQPDPLQIDITELMDDRNELQLIFTRPAGNNERLWADLFLEIHSGQPPEQ